LPFVLQLVATQIAILEAARTRGKSGQAQCYDTMKQRDGAPIPKPRHVTAFRDSQASPLKMLQAVLSA